MSNYQVVHFLFTLIMVLVLSYLFHQVFAKYKGLAYFITNYGEFEYLTFLFLLCAQGLLRFR